MRRVDLAAKCDELAGLAVSLSSSLERTNAQLHAARTVEDEAAKALPSKARKRLQRMGAISDASTIARLQERKAQLEDDLAAVSAMETWCQAQLTEATS